MSTPFRLGLIINPFAGIGGALGLKGSDGTKIREQALLAGAIPQAQEKAKRALQGLQVYSENIKVLTVSGPMGESLVDELGFDVEVCYQANSLQTESDDTLQGVNGILQRNPDLLVFVGGDGTARDIYAEVKQRLPVLGIPAGCKIHSSVFAVTPAGAGKVIEKMVQGKSVSVAQREVRDLDEELFRQGRVKAKHFGYMQVPSEQQYIQGVKMGGIEQEELVLAEISDFVREQLEGSLAVMGSGSTIDFIMKDMQVKNTLLGVDLIQNEALLASDVNESQIIEKLEVSTSKLVITIIGGQGHLLGRGNQQLSPQVIEKIGLENILIVASKAKLASLDGRPMIVDSGDESLDKLLCGYRQVITGYNDFVLYPIASPGLDIESHAKEN